MMFKLLVTWEMQIKTTWAAAPYPYRWFLINVKTENLQPEKMGVGKNVEKLEVFCSVVGVWRGAGGVESSLVVPPEVKHAIPVPCEPAISLLRVFLGEMETYVYTQTRLSWLTFLRTFTYKRS